MFGGVSKAPQERFRSIFNYFRVHFLDDEKKNWGCGTICFSEIKFFWACARQNFFVHKKGIEKLDTIYFHLGSHIWGYYGDISKFEVRGSFLGLF